MSRAPDTSFTCTVNGESRTARCAPLARLLGVLREDLRLTGSLDAWRRAHPEDAL